MYDFGVNLRTLRKKNKMTQQQLAKRLNVSESLISRYESNEVQPPFETLRALSATLNVSIDELCGTSRKETLSTYGLTSEQCEAMQAVISHLRAINMDSDRESAKDHNLLLGYIVNALVEFFNSKKNKKDQNSI